MARCFLYIVISLSLAVLTASLDWDKNDFDTYNPDCKRIRRPWLSLSSDEKQDYIDALLELRKKGNGKVQDDEVVAVGSAHMEIWGEIAHTASSYLFWHGYLLWELESRIRNLGGKYACYGIPYWDFSTEAENYNSIAHIFNDDVNHLGGVGDPHNAFAVNGFSWDVPTRDYWVPTHCTAAGDNYPLCSLKRASTGAKMIGAVEVGQGIAQHEDFATFSRWYRKTFNLPHNLLVDDQSLAFPVVTSFDPVWYLFHSMVSYHQGIWQDCHQYDQIKPADLDNFHRAYSTYCDGPFCGDLSLDAKMYFGGWMQGHDWAFFNQQDMTIRKAYHQPRWNVIYDLGDGSGFYSDSGLNKFCKDKLNPNWFMLNQNSEEDGHDTTDHTNSNENIVEKDTLSLLAATSGEASATALVPNSQLLAVIFFAVVLAIAATTCCLFKNGEKGTKRSFTRNFAYGTV